MERLGFYKSIQSFLKFELWPGRGLAVDIVQVITLGADATSMNALKICWAGAETVILIYSVTPITIA